MLVSYLPSICEKGGVLIEKEECVMSSARPKVKHLLMLLFIVVSVVVAYAADVIVYNAAGDDEIHRRLAALYERQTGKTVMFLRLSSGEMSARVMAEAARPRADVVAGIAEEHLIPLRDKGLLRQPARPDEMDYFPDESAPDHGYWYGYFTTVLGFCVNTPVFKQLWPDKDIPQTWDDFLDPAFRDEIVMPNPVLSGTAYTFVLTILLQYEDEEEGWSYLERFTPQLGLVTASGVAPSRMVAVGEFPIGVTFAHDAARNIRAGFPMEFVVPGKTGSTTGLISVVKGGPNGAEAADHFINWYLSVDAQQLHTDLRLEASMHSEVILPAGLPRFVDLELVDIDADWAAAERDRILERWEEVLDAPVQ